MRKMRLERIFDSQGVVEERRGEERSSGEME
jgi:hypothetical protein